MRLLFLTHAFNSLAQRLFVELREDGHEVSVELDINEATTLEAYELFQPELVIVPFMKRMIPEALWRRVPCLVVHPGIRGDRGPSSLDWAILEEAPTWGVTVLQANAEPDAGEVWATAEFALPRATKSEIYRREVADAATRAVRGAIARYQAAGGIPAPLPTDPALAPGRLRPAMRQADRQIDWHRDSTETVLRKLRASDSSHGVRDRLGEAEWWLFGGHAEGELRGAPGEILAHRDGALCRATCDGAVWITHLQSTDRPSLKLPAAFALQDRLAAMPVIPARSQAETYREISYHEQGQLGFLTFDFYNGAMSTDQCRRLQEAFEAAAERPTRVIVLRGGADFWSNGLNLHLIEAAESPADASWENILALDDLVRAIVTCERQLTIAAMRGNAAAGGVFLALACDRVVAREGIVLNPHYRAMGNLYGSEYWTYLLPRRVGPEHAQALTESRLPLGVAQALRLGLVDEVLPASGFADQLDRLAADLAARPDYPALLATKTQRRQEDEAIKPLEAYRTEELARMRLNFYGFDPSYHVARYHFVYRLPHSRTPSFLASHRAVEVTP